jgi:hypothetical protein
MRVARPTPERFNEIIDFQNWLTDAIYHLEDNCPDDVDKFIRNLRPRIKEVDHKIRHVVTVCDALIEQLCDLDSDTLETRKDIITYLQDEEAKEKLAKVKS